MNARTKNSAHAIVIIVTIAVVMTIARQGFAWTNPGGAPPFASPSISTSGGNVGIGTATPGTKLEVASDGVTFTYPAIGTGKGSFHVSPVAGTNDNTASVTFGANSAGSLVNSGQAGIYVQSSGVYGTKMYFGTTDSYAAGSKARMLIDYNGNVGIGTTNPGAGVGMIGGLTINGTGSSVLNIMSSGINSFALNPGGAGAAWTMYDYAAGSWTGGISQKNGTVGIGTISPDPNYKLTTSGGGVKAETNTAQPAGYFNNTGGGTAITVGTGGITLGGVNQTTWPSGTDSTKVLKTGDTMTGGLTINSAGGAYIGDGTSKLWIGGAGTTNYIESGNAAFNASPILYFTGANGTSGNFDFNGNVGIGIGNAVPSYKLDVAGTIRTQGDFLANANYGLGLVGLYDPTKYRNVYSMGSSYRLPADGSGPGNLYGIAMTYEPNYGGAGNNAQAVTGLGHQFLFMSNGVTQSAVGTGVYTVGNMTALGTVTAQGGSSSNWAAVNAPSFNAGGSIYSYGSICTGNASGVCSGINGTVLGINNTSAANNIPNTGVVFFNSGSVGIGTTAPGYKLDVAGDINFTGTLRQNGVAVSSGIGGSGTTNYLSKWTAGTALGNSQIFDNGTNVGIGTASPAYTLDVNGTGRFGTSALIGTGVAAGYYQDASNGAYRSLNVAGNTGYYFQGYNGTPTTLFVGLQGTYAGRVGIGTTAPASTLAVGGPGVAYTGVYGTADTYGVYGFTQYGSAGVYGQSNYDTGVYGYGATQGVIGKAYDIGFGATGVYGEGIYNPTYNSSGYGVYGKSPNGYGVYCSGLTCGGNRGWTNSSDARLKKNVQTISDPLEKVMKLRGVTFDWKDGGGTDMGFIAQETKDVIPEIVTKDQSGYYAMRTASLTGVLVEAVKAQQKQISELEGEIKSMKK